MLTPGSDIGEATLSEEERVHATRLLTESRDRILARCAGLAPGEWERADGPGRWTVAAVVEHLVLVERGFPRMIEKMLGQAANSDWAAQTAGKDDLVRQARSAERKIAAPETVHPRGGIAAGDLAAEFEAARAAVLAVAAAPGLRIKEHYRPHPAFGLLNGYQWMLLIGYHSERHRGQIERCLGVGG